MQAMTESVNCLSEEVSHAAMKMTRPPSLSPVQ